MAQPTPRQVALHNVKVPNPDGSVSTERSATFQTNAGFVNVPTLIDGIQFKPRAAFYDAQKKGNLGRPYRSVVEATMAARRRSGAIGKEIQRLGQKRAKK
jgi:hypothetical protein